jgi:hypothetical protein
MRQWLPLTFLLASLQLQGCAQEAGKSRKGGQTPVGVEKTPAEKVKKKPIKDEDTSTADGQLCKDTLSLANLQLSPEEKNLKVDGVSTSLCTLLKDSGKKVLMFQVVEKDCTDCAEKILRTKNYFALSTLNSNIGHVLLFQGTQPSSSDIKNLSGSDTASAAFDFKKAFINEFSDKPASDGTAFILISSSGEVQTHTGTKYLDAISKAEALAKKLSVPLTEKTPDVLKASKLEWNGKDVSKNKRFSLVATE